VDGQKVPSFQELAALVDGRSRAHPGQPLELSIRRSGAAQALTVLAELDPAAGKYRMGVGIGPGAPLTSRVVHQVLVGTPAEKAGFLSGDELLSVDGKPLADGTAFNGAFSESLSETVQVEVLRQGRPLVLAVPRRQPVPESMEGGVMGLLGLELQAESDLSFQKMGVLTAARVSFFESAYQALLMVDGLVSLVRGKLGLRESIGGPITMLRMAHQQAENGLIQLLNLMVSFSIMLCVMNLLPVPLLDGGSLVLCFLEGLRRKPLSLKAQSRLQYVGIGLLSALFLFATSNDLVNWFHQAVHSSR
jgi:regulator of sigma E protease